MLEKDPAERTRSASDAWDAFEEIVIGLVGPRWRRTARVLEPSRRPPDTPAGPFTPPPSAAARPPLMPTLGVPDRPPAEPRTRRLRDRERTGSARTVMPDAPTRRLEDPGPEPRPGRRRGALLVKAVLVSFALLVALAAAFGGRGSDPASEAGVATPVADLTGRDLALRVPSGWSRLRRPPDLGLPLARASAAAPQGDPAGPLVEFGMAQGGAAANSTLLPQSFLSAIGNGGGAAPARTAVLLPVQGLQAWRYRGLRPVGTPGELTVYAVPTSGGVATLACSAPAAQAEAFARQCEAIAGTLQLRRGTPYPIGPSDAYASALNSTIGELQQTSSSQEASLQAAVTLEGQATAAQALARAYEGAAAQLAALDLSPADRNANGRLVTSLRAAASAYRAAARAATAGDADGYRAASAAIPGAKDEVNAALAGVRAAGYEPAGGTTPPAADGSQPAAPAQPQSAPEPSSDPEPQSNPKPQSDPKPQGGVGDSKSDDPSDDEEDPDDS